MTLSSHLVRRLSFLTCATFLAGLLLAPGTATAQGDAPAPSVAAPGSSVWSATITVGNNRGLLGYTTFSERAVGSLSSNSFSWRGGSYTVTNIAYNQSRGSAGTWDVLIDVWPPLQAGIECLTLRLGDQWLNLADARGNSRQFFWYEVDLDWRFRDEIAVSLREFHRGFEARSFDGYGNNRFEPELGMAPTPLLRLSGVSFAYGMTREPEPDLPDPRLISNIVSVQSEPMLNTAQATDMVWQWGQFLDHDISLTPEASPGETLRIPIPRGDPVFDPFNSGIRTMAFNRSAVDPDTGTAPDNPREQVNVITAFIDASNVYGSDDSRARALRTNDGTGKLKTSGGGLLPYNEDRLANDNGNSRQVQSLFLAGDIRVNEQVGLTALHTLFVREHNRLADFMAPEQSGMTGQEIYELARKIVGAQMQVITYNEFLPLLLGPDAIGPYEGYNPAVDPSIANEFSTGAYRFGHTMLSASLLLIDDGGTEQEMPLLSAFFNPSLMADQGISRVLRGLTTQQAQRIDARLVDNVRNLLFGAPGGPGRDLAALNIQRGRDHGLPGLHQRPPGLQPAAAPQLSPMSVRTQWRSKSSNEPTANFVTLTSGREGWPRTTCLGRCLAKPSTPSSPINSGVFVMETAIGLRTTPTSWRTPLCSPRYVPPRWPMSSGATPQSATKFPTTSSAARLPPSPSQSSSAQPGPHSIGPGQMQSPSRTRFARASCSTT